MSDITYKYLKYVGKTGYSLQIMCLGDQPCQIVDIAKILNQIDIALYKHIYLSINTSEIISYKLKTDCYISPLNPVIHWDFVFIFDNKIMLDMAYNALYSAIGESK